MNGVNRYFVARKSSVQSLHSSKEGTSEPLRYSDYART